MSIKLESGKLYLCEDGSVVKVKKNSLPEYKFSLDEGYKIESGKLVKQNWGSLVWKENGISYHFDCGLNIVSEYIIGEN